MVDTTNINNNAINIVKTGAFLQRSQQMINNNMIPEDKEEKEKENLNKNINENKDSKDSNSIVVQERDGKNGENDSHFSSSLPSKDSTEFQDNESKNELYSNQLNNNVKNEEESNLDNDDEKNQNNKSEDKKHQNESNSIITGKPPVEPVKDEDIINSITSNKTNMENVVIPERAELKNSNGKVRRPRNAFILFRSHQHKIFINGFLNAGKAIPHNSEISKMIGTQWRSLSPKEKAVWENAALKEREEHLSKYPDYKYQPVRRKVKKELRDKEKVLKKQQKRAMEALEKHRKLMVEAVPANPLHGLTMHSGNVFPGGPMVSQPVSSNQKYQQSELEDHSDNVSHYDSLKRDGQSESKQLEEQQQQQQQEVNGDNEQQQQQQQQMLGYGVNDGSSAFLNGYYGQDAVQMGSGSNAQLEQLKLQQQQKQYQQYQQFEQMRLLQQQQQYQLMQQRQQYQQQTGTAGTSATTSAAGGGSGAPPAAPGSSSNENMQDLYEQQQQYNLYNQYNQAAKQAAMTGYGSAMTLSNSSSGAGVASSGTATNDQADPQNSAALMQQQYYLYQQQQQQQQQAANSNPSLYGGNEISYDYYYQNQQDQQPQQAQQQQPQQQQQYAQYYQQTLPQGYYYAQGPDGQTQIFQQQPSNEDMYQQQ